MNPGASVLVVDDDADNGQNLADILTDLGYHVDTATDGAAAVELARRRPYDVALLDLRMPGMDGLETYRAIRRLRPSTVALIVTAYAGIATAEDAKQAGAWQIVPKPVDLPRLLGLVGEAVGQPLVLVVDDDPDLCATLWDLLRDRGYRVGVAHDPAGAAGQLRDARFHVVLIDMRLPGGTAGTSSDWCGSPTRRPGRCWSPAARARRARSWSAPSPRGPTPSATSRSTCPGCWACWPNSPASGPRRPRPGSAEVTHDRRIGPAGAGRRGRRRHAGQPGGHPRIGRLAGRRRRHPP
jgi:CheY-like chemotaxis protein